MMSAPCKVDLACPAKEHDTNCPWHPDNVQHMKLSDADWDKLMDDLNSPPKVLPKLAELLGSQLTKDEAQSVEWLMECREYPISMNARAASLVLRHPIERVQMIVAEVRRRLEVAR